MSAAFSGGSFLRSSATVANLNSTLALTIACRAYCTDATTTEAILEVFNASEWCAIWKDTTKYDAEITGTDNYGGVPVANTWQHVAIVFPAGDPSTLTLYVDGVSVATPSIAGRTASSLLGKVTIGSSQYTGGSFPFTGSIQDVVVVQRELAAAEIQQLATSRMPKIGAMAAWYPLFPDGNRLKDWSGNGKDLVATGSVVDGVVAPTPWGR